MSPLKPSLMDYTLTELESLISPKFRVKQIYGWLYHNFGEISDSNSVRV